jgi:hypothetical protein
MDLTEAKHLYLKEAIKNKKAKTSVSQSFVGDLPAKDHVAFENYVVLFKEIEAIFDKNFAENENNDRQRLLFYLLQLNKYRTRKDSDKFQILKMLITELDLPKEVAHQKIFEDTVHLFEDRLDFFCSYTARGAPSINNAYQVAIRSQFGSKSDLKETWSKSNYLAHMIAKFYTTLGYKGFFDRTGLKSGDWIDKKIKDACENAIVFVQLLEQESFDPLDESANELINWSYKEYCTYANGSNLKYIFYRHPILDEPEADLGTINWYKLATSHQGVLSTIIDLKWDDNMIKYRVNTDAKAIRQMKDKLFKDITDKV